MFRQFFAVIWKRMVQGRLIFSSVDALRKTVVKLVNITLNIVKKISKLADFAIIYPSRFLMTKMTKVEDKVMFLTFQGDYTCNPKGIAEALIRAGVDYPLVWAVRGKASSSVYPLNMKLVSIGSYEFYKELASSRVVIENTNSLERMHVFKKKNQYWIQTWHGSLGIKRLDGDAVMSWRWKQLALKCQKSIDFLYSNSDFETEVFETAYWKGVPSVLTGHARNDILFTQDEAVKAKIRRKVSRALGIDGDTKILLYAPTHRDNVGEGFYGLDYKLIKDALEERFGGKWQIVVRLHNRLRRANLGVGNALPDYVSDATSYDDMQDLLLCTDAGVTDYSSWIFDFVLTGRPGFIIQLDAEDFANARGFYYPIETTPFPIAADSREFAENIRKFDEEAYAKDVKRFLKERGCMEDGHAGERIVKHINSLMKHQRQK